MNRIELVLALFLGLGLTAASSARAQDFIDNRLTITFGDDDILAPTGEQVPLSPMPGFGDRPAYQLFFDSLNTRFSGRETLTHLVVYKKMPAFSPNLTTEAALVVRLDLSSLALTDAGSYIRASYNPWSTSPDDGLALVLFPFDTERFRLGYLYTLSFGGADFIPRRSLLRAPGLKLQFDRSNGTYFIGFKTIPAREPLEVSVGGADTEVEVVRVDETQYMFLGGAGWDIANDLLRIDIGGGYFQQGRLDLPGYPRAPVYSLGGAARFAIHHNLPIASSIDFSLYKNDPSAPFQAFRPVSYTAGQFGYLVSVEGNIIGQHLADVDRTNETTIEPAVAAALQTRLQYGYFRLEVTALYRELSYILKNVPSFVPFLSIPTTARVDPEFFFAATADYHFPKPRITLGLSAGIQLPATFTTVVNTGTADASRTLVVRQEGQFSILPPGLSAVPIVQSRLQMRIDVSEMLYTQAWLQYIHDENATRLVVSESEGTRRIFQRADQFGFGVSVAARY